MKVYGNEKEIAEYNALEYKSFEDERCKAFTISSCTFFENKDVGSIGDFRKYCDSCRNNIKNEVRGAKCNPNNPNTEATA